MLTKTKQKPGPKKKPAKRRQSLTERAYEGIKLKLMRAEYQPGQFLQEASICDDLKIGRTPVHQALHILHQEGFVQIIPRKGILVNMISFDELYEALEARILVEPYCAAQCALKATAAQKRKFLTLLNRYDNLTDNMDPQKLMQIDFELHSTILTIAGNPLLTSFLKPIHENMTRSWMLPHWQSIDFDMTGAEHTDIIIAINDGDSKTAASSMRKHIESLFVRNGLSHKAAQTVGRHSVMPLVGTVK